MGLARQAGNGMQLKGEILLRPVFAWMENAVHIYYLVPLDSSL